MACVKCGESTEREVYICEKCVEEANSQFHLGMSMAICPSILNYMGISGSGILGLEGEITPDALNLLGDVGEEDRFIKEMSFHIEDLTEESCKKLLAKFTRMFINMGLPLDLEKKLPPIITQGDLALAEKLLKGAEEIESRFPNLSDIELYLLIGSMYHTLSKVNCGVITTANRGYHLIKAGEYFDKVLSIDQSLLPAWKNKAKTLLEMGENNEAIQCFDWILENLKIPSDDISVLLNKGIALFNYGSLKEAGDCFNGVLDKDPGNVEAWHRKGDIFAKSDRWGGAIQCYNEAIKHDPGRDDIWMAMSEIYVNHEKYMDASKCLDEVLKINIWNIDAWYLQGMVFSKIGRWGAAIQCLNKALSINPSHIKAWKAKGELLLSTDRYDEALDCYERALKFQPKNIELLSSKIKTLKLMKRYDEALESVEEALKMEGNDPDLLFERGDILQETGKAFKALKSLDKVLIIKPSSVEAHYKKGLTLEKLRRYKDAIQSYEKALELNPNFEKALEAKKDCQLRMKGKS